MPILEMKVPSPGESISEVEIAAWLVSDGDYVFKDQAIAEVDSDKATLELPAEMGGTITLKAEEGDAVAVGAVVCLIDTDAEAPAKPPAPAQHPHPRRSGQACSPQACTRRSKKTSPGACRAGGTRSRTPFSCRPKAHGRSRPEIGPGGRHRPRWPRVEARRPLRALAAGVPQPNLPGAGWSGSREVRRDEKMSMLRRKVAERLVGVKNETAMLTTFNEVDMKPIMDLRKQYKDAVQGAPTEWASASWASFTKAVTSALELYPCGQWDDRWQGDASCTTTPTSASR